MPAPSSRAPVPRVRSGVGVEMRAGGQSLHRTRGDRRPRQAITGSPPPGLQPVMAAPYSNDRGPRTGLARRESRWVSERLAFYRYMALSSHGTPLNLTRGLLANLHSPGDFPEGSRLFSGLVRRCNGPWFPYRLPPGKLWFGERPTHGGQQHGWGFGSWSLNCA